MLNVNRCSLSFAYSCICLWMGTDAEEPASLE